MALVRIWRKDWEKQAKEEEREKAAEGKGSTTMSISDIVTTLRKEGSLSQVHPYTCDNPPRSPEMTTNGEISATQGSS